MRAAHDTYQLGFSAMTGGNATPRTPTSELLAALSGWLDRLAVDTVSLQRLGHYKRLQDRLPQAAVLTAALSEANALRDAHRVPFWEALLLALHPDDPSADAVLAGAAHQHEPSTGPWQVATEDLAGAGAAVAEAAAHGEDVVVLSEVQSVCRPRHLAMVDFRLPATSSNEALVRLVAQELGGGLLVASGHSYHLYGSRLLDLDEFHAFLGLAAQFNPIVDGRWAAHQHRAGRAALRISPRNGTSPRVLGVVAPRDGPPPVRGTPAGR